MKKKLKNKPLLESIFELKWELKKNEGGLYTDQHYKILVGRLYDKLQKTYPYHEQMPSSQIPDELAKYIVQHRLRKDKDKWPLFQIGPGILTLNETKDYEWVDFKKRIKQLLTALYESYPKSDKIKVNNLMLRYLNGIKFDFSKNNVVDFLKNNFGIAIEIEEKFFESSNINNTPENLDVKCNFSSVHPKGTFSLRFTSGKMGNDEALIWEFNLNSINLNIKNQRSIEKWVEEAHDLIEKWFFKTIENGLLERFK
jgi:uncharacterized protein (TIGR04255 family)